MYVCRYDPPAAAVSGQRTQTPCTGMNTLAQYGFKKPKPVVPEPVKRRPGRPSKAAKSAEEERAAAAKREADAAYDHELELVATA